MIKFFHIADTHFGIENYGKSDVSTGIHSRLLDFDAALGFCVDCAIKDNIDCLLFCGDAYKTSNPTPTQQRLFAKQMLRLQSAGIPVVIVVGNHDHPLSFGKSHSLDVFSYLPVDGFYVISKPEILKLKTKSGDLQILGIPWPTRNNLITNEIYRFKSNAEIIAFLSERVGQIISSFAQSLDQSLPSVLAAHLTVSNGIFSGSEKCAIFGNDPIFLPSQLAIKPFDYVALGHLHRYQNLNQGGIPVVYSGSIERIDFGERKENKGFCRVEIETAFGQKNCKHVFIEVPTRRMLQIEVVLDDGKDFTQQVIDEVKKSDITDAIIKILYHLPEGKVDKIDLLEVIRVCDKAHCIASITPIFKVAARERRAGVSVDMAFDLLLDKYFDSKKIDDMRKANLLKKAQELQSQFEVGNES